MIAFDLITRLAIGAFFAISGYHKLFDPVVSTRIQHLFNSLGVGHLWVIVATGELLGGLGILTGTLTPVACAGMIVILIGAIYLDVWKTDVVGKNPRDICDWIAKTIYCSEVLLIIILIDIAVSPAVFGVDTIVAGWLS